MVTKTKCSICGSHVFVSVKREANGTTLSITPCGACLARVHRDADKNGFVRGANTSSLLRVS